MFLRSALSATARALAFWLLATVLRRVIWHAVRPAEATQNLAVPSPLVATTVQEQRSQDNDVHQRNALLQVLGAPQFEEFDEDVVENSERYNQRDFIQTIKWFDYFLSLSGTLRLAFQHESAGLQAGAFLSHMHRSNAWLKYSIRSLEDMQKLASKLQKIVSNNNFTEETKEQLVAEECARLLLDKMSPAEANIASIETTRLRLVEQLRSSGAARSAASLAGRMQTPALFGFQSVVSLGLALVCKRMSTTIVSRISTRLSKAKNRVTRAAGYTQSRILNLDGDIIGEKIVEEMYRGNGASMIALLFQLHAVDLDEVVQEGENVQSGVFAGSGAQAPSDGLFLGAVDFGTAFSKAFEKYLSIAVDMVLYCYGELTSGDNSEAELDAFLNGDNADGTTPATRLALWCHKNRKYVDRLQSNLATMAEAVMKEMVEALKFEFLGFRDYLVRMLSILYELAFALLERESSASSRGTTLQSDVDALRSSRTYNPQLPLGSETPREMFRTPWIKEAVTNLAHGFFEAAGSLCLLKSLKDGRFNSNNANYRGVCSSAYTMLTGASQKFYSAVKDCFGNFFNAQNVIAQVFGQKERLSMFAALNKDSVTWKKEEPFSASTITENQRFIAGALLAVNLGINADPEDLIMQKLRNRGYENTHAAYKVLHCWQNWMLRHRVQNSSKGSELLASAKMIETLVAEKHFLNSLSKAMEGRLRFVQTRKLKNGCLRLYDFNGKSAIFTPISRDMMDRKLPQIRHRPFGAPARFEVRDRNYGKLRFAENPNLPLEGALTYENSRQAMHKITKDLSAIKDLLVSQLALQTTRLGAEAIAHVILQCYLHNPASREQGFSQFLDSLTPKMLMDTMYILGKEGMAELPDSSLDMKGDSLQFSFSKEALLDAFSTGMSTALSRVHLIDFKTVAAVAAYGSVYNAVSDVRRHRTGQHLVLEGFQEELRYVIEALKSKGVLESVPECAFIEEMKDSEIFLLKCALYRYLKLRSLDLTKAAEEDMTVETVRKYLSAIVSHLNKLRKNTSWKRFLNYGTTAQSTKEPSKAENFNFENLEENIQQGLLDEADDDAGSSSAALNQQQGLGSFLSGVLSHTVEMGVSTARLIKRGVQNLTTNMRNILGHQSIPSAIRVVNVLDAEQFIGAIESAEFQTFGEEKPAPTDVLKASDLQSFGQVKQALARTKVYLANSKQMSTIITHLRSIPLVSHESENVLEKIRAKLRTMEKSDIKAAIGYVVAMGVSRGLATGTIGKAMMALADPKYGLKDVPHQDAVNLFRMLDMDSLAYVLKSLSLVIALKHMKNFSDEDAYQTFRFVPKASLSLAYPTRTTILPLYQAVNVRVALRNIEKSRLLTPATYQFQLTDSQEACLELFEYLKAKLGLKDITIRTLFSAGSLLTDRRTWMTCALYLLLKDIEQAGKPVTVADILHNLQEGNSTLLKILEVHGHTTDIMTRYELYKRSSLADMLTIINTAVADTPTDRSFVGYNPRTKHIKYRDLAMKTIAEMPLYDALRESAEAVVSGTPLPKSVHLQLSSQFLKAYLKEVQTDRLNLYVEQHPSNVDPTLINKEQLKEISLVYTLDDLMQCMLSLRQRSFHNIRAVAKGASQRILSEGEGTLKNYGLAMMLLDLGELTEQAKLHSYKAALEEGSRYQGLSLVDREIWKQKAAQGFLYRSGTFQEAAAALTVDDRGLILDAIQKELSERFELVWRELQNCNLSEWTLRTKIWSYITLPRVSLQSVSRIDHNTSLGQTLINAYVEGKMSTEVLKLLANEIKLRQQKKLSEAQPGMSREDYLAKNILQDTLDMLQFVLTGKAERYQRPPFMIQAMLWNWFGGPRQPQETQSYKKAKAKAYQALFEQGPNK